MKTLFKDIKSVLVLSPHTDDMEFGCGGTISRLVREGKKITNLVFSICEESVPHGLEKNTLQKECIASGSVIGINEENLIINKFKVRKFPNQRQEILEELIRVRNNGDYDLIFMPSSNDFHQDHKVIFEEGLRAFKNSNLIGYQLNWNNLTTFNQFFVKLEECDLDKKIESLKEYESQSFRPYASSEIIKSQSQLLGLQSGRSKYAESFEVIRLFS